MVLLSYLTAQHITFLAKKIFRVNHHDYITIVISYVSLVDEDDDVSRIERKVESVTNQVLL